MPTSLKVAVDRYARAENLSRGTRDGYSCTLGKWKRWGGGPSLERLTRSHVREFLDWVYDDAVTNEGRIPGRTANKTRANLQAILSWAWEQEIIESLPCLPRPKAQGDVAGCHYLAKAELNALYFATHSMRRPQGWDREVPVGRYWRCALVLFFNYDLDTGTVWRSIPKHEPIRWRHASLNPQAPDGRVKQRSRWGWLLYRRIKTGKTFCRPMNRVVHAHIKNVMPAEPQPNEPVRWQCTSQSPVPAAVRTGRHPS